MSVVDSVSHQPASGPEVRGFLHRSPAPGARGMILAHGAGSNVNAPLLVNACTFFAEVGIQALRIDLPFRWLRPSGPPMPAHSAQDRAGLANAVRFLRAEGASSIILGGHSYGGRQATMLAAEEPAIANALLLFSYPLHPPAKPAQLRTAHFPTLRIPSVFVHGARDPFGTLDEMNSALALMPARHRLIEVAGAGHDLRKPPLDKALQSVLEILESDR